MCSFFTVQIRMPLTCYLLHGTDEIGNKIIPDIALEDVFVYIIMYDRSVCLIRNERLYLNFGKRLQGAQVFKKYSDKEDSGIDRIK